MTLDLTDNLIKNVRAFIWKKEGDKLYFLITQEPSGNFSIPGGCKDLEDADLMATLRRELQEELGLNTGDYSIQETDIQKEYDNLYNTGERAGKKTIISIFIISGLTKEPVASSEIKGITWMSAEDALNAFNAPHSKELFRLSMAKIMH
jgi:8-oxo-dGTP pyrophosphatase MutT (NUDIX family)